VRLKRKEKICWYGVGKGREIKDQQKHRFAKIKKEIPKAKKDVYGWPTCADSSLKSKQQVIIKSCQKIRFKNMVVYHFKSKVVVEISKAHIGQ